MSDCCYYHLNGNNFIRTGTVKNKTFILILDSFTGLNSFFFSPLLLFLLISYSYFCLARLHFLAIHGHSYTLMFAAFEMETKTEFLVGLFTIYPTVFVCFGFTFLANKMAFVRSLYTIRIYLYTCICNI